MARGRHNVHGRNWQRRFVRVGIACTACTLSLAVAAFLVLKPKSPDSYQASSPHPSQAVVARPPLPRVANYGLPVRLKIPKLTVDAPIIYLGLTKTGHMAAPANITDVGWFKGGSLPGNKGSAVLAGHIDGLRGQPGVFASLDKLQKGDVLQVIDSNSTVISFTVKETRTYSEDEQPSEVFNDTGAARLNLITCTGTWDNAQRHFLERLVVFTDKSG